MAVTPTTQLTDQAGPRAVASLWSTTRMPCNASYDAPLFRTCQRTDQALYCPTVDEHFVAPCAQLDKQKRSRDAIPRRTARA